MTAPRITVVGSYATGLTMKVERLPTTGETLLATGYRVDHGGKGSNQAVGCARLGARVSFVAKIGKDAFGEMALQLYRNEGVEASSVKQTPDAPTGVGFILVESSSGKNCIALDPGANELLTAEDVSQSDAAFDSAVVVLTQLEIPVQAAGEALAQGRAHGALTILNPAPVRPLPPSVLASVDVLTPNEVEAKLLLGCNLDEEVEAEKIARELIRRGVRNVVMTLGEKGALIVTSASAKRVPAVSVQPRDTTGAGDAFNAGLATALAGGSDLESAVQFATVTGALAVTQEGVIPSLPYREAAVRFCRQSGLPVPPTMPAAGAGN
jgi:ribokinase